MADDDNCIHYKPKFDKDKLSKTKVTVEYEDGTTRNKHFYKFDGYGGAECLLFVEEEFDDNAEEMGFEIDDYFNKWKEILGGTAKSKWRNVIASMGEFERNQENFNRARATLRQKYCGGEEGKDNMIVWLGKVKRPVGTDVEDHIDRMETLCRYTNKMAGDEPDIDEVKKKKFIFDSFPDSWKIKFKRGKKLANTSLDDLQIFMTNEKKYADLEAKKHEKKNNKNNDNNKDNGGKKNDKNNKRKNDGKDAGNTPCRIHNGQHLWKDCYNNRNGRNYRPNGGRGGRGGRWNNNNPGRGGQGNGGRGGRGNGGYNNQNNNNNNNQGQNYHYNGTGYQYGYQNTNNQPQWPGPNAGNPVQGPQQPNGWSMNYNNNNGSGNSSVAIGNGYQGGPVYPQHN